MFSRVVLSLSNSFLRKSKYDYIFNHSSGIHDIRHYKERNTAFIASLNTEERENLMNELQKLKLVKSHEETKNKSKEIKPLTFGQLRSISIVNGLPFIGFGFFDNAIMIIAGEYIDIAFTTKLGMSTMAAAGFGNLISDVFGIGLVGYVERYSQSLGFEVEPIEPEQYGSSSAKIASTFGRFVGITIGCLLGMTPLLFFGDKSISNQSKIET